ncbi:Lipopolysaccharide export LptBFGC system, permease protein LptF [Marinitoga hydrogenitolerans DSM 16785]|uniref:Lipopolysaccharide export LptBFGC system, permease protein LptF n=1 Tax=Marinitoga hydrogenitolerans (strain DSM 16785 / JCM 12826 / AT1271) TaxID=1122195 RepID=A0A1M4SZ62_MARH1|nr:LptF/LptG family permease [Marinitoga hydrogenitolerans]SHE37516.1 Lipopolysaccharide export LptBFGC system, permease protein LptF [Marinitoga hydrogenitolerans DSM 16785]
MQKLIKYISKEFISPFFMGLIGFIVFVSVELLYQLSDIIVRNKVGIDKLFILIAYHIPYFLVMGIPVGILFSIFWVLSRLSNDNEIIALQSLGIPSKRIVIPFIFLAIILSFLTFSLYDTIVPKSNMKAKEAISKYVYKNVEANIEMNKFVEVEKNKKYLYVRKIDKDSGILYGLLLYEVDYSKTTVFHAEKAFKDKDKWYMENGRIFRLTDDGLLKLDITFKKLELDISKNVEEYLRFSKSPNDMTTRELKHKIEITQKLGGDASALIVGYQEKFSNSFAPIVISLLGVALSLFINLRSKSWSVISTFVLVVLYQGSGAWLSALGKERILNPYLAPWIPNIIFGIVGIILFVLLDTRAAYKLIEPLKRVFGTIIILILLSSQGFSEKVYIESPNITIEGTKITFEGSTIINYKDSIIKAQKGFGELNDENKIIKASLFGNVTYIQDKRTIEASSMEINFESKDVVLNNTYSIESFKNKNKKTVKLRVWSGISEKKTDEDVVFSKKVKLTTCKECPTYYFKASHVTIYPEQFLVARDVILEFFGIPVFYFPFYFQSLSGEKEAPFIAAFAFKEDTITISVKINHTFANNSSLSFFQEYARNVKEDKLSQSMSYTYTIPFILGTLAISNSIKDNSFSDLRLSLSKKLELLNFSSSLSHSFSSNTDSFSINIKDIKTGLGKFSLSSSFLWKDRNITSVKFLNLSTPSLTKKYKKTFFKINSTRINITGPATKLFESWKEKTVSINTSFDSQIFNGNKKNTIKISYSSLYQKDELKNFNLYIKNDITDNYKPLKYNKDIFFLDSSITPQLKFAFRNSYPNKIYNYYAYGLKANFKTKLSIFQYGISDYQYYRVLVNEPKWVSNPATHTNKLTDFMGTEFNLKIFDVKNFFDLRYNRTFDFMQEKAEDRFITHFLTSKYTLNYNKLSFENNTRTDLEKEKIDFIKTKFNGFIKYDIFKHNYQFDYDHKNEIMPITVINNKSEIIFGKNKIEINYDYYLKKETFKESIPQIKSKYLFYDSNGGRYEGNLNFFNEYKNIHYDLKYKSKGAKQSLILNLDYDIENEYLKTGIGYNTSTKYDWAKISFIYDIKNNVWNFTQFELNKRLICWSLYFKGDLKLLPKFSLKSFEFKFFITDIPEKSVGYTEEKGVDINLF